MTDLMKTWDGELLDASDAIGIDEQYDGVLAAIAFAGGRATLDQIGRFLGGDTVVRQAFLQTVHRRGYGYFDDPKSRYPVRSQGYVIAVEVSGEFSNPNRDLGPSCWPADVAASVYRFEHRLREGRDLYRLLDCDARALFAGEGPWAHYLDALRVLLPFSNVYIDFHPDGMRLVTVDHITWCHDFWKMVDAVPHLARGLGAPMEWCILAGSRYQAGRMEALLRLIGDEIPPVVRPRVVQYDLARYFAPIDRIGELDGDPFGDVFR